MFNKFNECVTQFLITIVEHGLIEPWVISECTVV